MPQNDKLNSVLYQNKPWDNNENNIWLASKINLHRNLEKFPFPVKLPKEKRQQIISLISKKLLMSPGLKNPLLVKTEEIGPLQKEYLVEHFLSNQSFQQAHSGEAFIIDESGTFLATLNVNDHVQFELIDCKGELESAWNHIVKIETELGEEFNYSYSSKFGFLTSDIMNCGTGFILKVFLQPSALIHSNLMAETISKIKSDGVRLYGLQGNPTEIVGDIYVISNEYALGLTEENVISVIRLFITKLLVEENSLRSFLRKHENPIVIDKVSRAYGVLAHSYQIETIEALNAISLLKLGADLGLLEGVTPQELNRLFFACRRAHLLSKLDGEINQDHLAHKRAEFIHSTLSKVKLKI